jgi:hypothetical protein
VVVEGENKLLLISSEKKSVLENLLEVFPIGVELLWVV